MSPPPRRRVVIVAVPGAQSLDVTGPLEAFAHAGAAYRLVVASRRGGRVVTSSGLAIDTVALTRLRPRPTDTVVVAGADEAGIRAAIADRALGRWLARAGRRVERIGSVCSGAFLLAAAGVLDGHRVATHWAACDRLARYRPAVTVDRDAIYVRSGRVWTSAGVTTGIDMALAMVEEDHGRAVADGVAAMLVLYARRPGFQSQWSDALLAQAAAGDPLAPLIAWARAHLRELDVPRLARHAALSPRTLHRRCVATLGTTPAKLIERLRVEHARELLGAHLGVKAAAARSGFRDAAQLSRAFRRTLGVLPRDYQRMFAA